MNQNEQDIQRFLQIREEIHQEIKKIEPNVFLLQEMTNRFVAHFDVFEKLSQNAQEQIKSAIKNVSYEVAELTTNEISKRIEDQIGNIVRALDHSVMEAKTVFENISRKNAVKITIILTLSIFLSFLIGFVIGKHYYEKRAHTLSRELLKNL